MVKELGDKAAQGRTYGNLGNTYYLLGEFENAVAAHEKVGSSYTFIQRPIQITASCCRFFCFSKTFSSTSIISQTYSFHICRNVILCDIMSCGSVCVDKLSM